VAHDAGAAGHRQEVGLEADEPRAGMVEPHAALAVGLHVLEVAAAAAPLPLTRGILAEP